jgi:hypothetical protein
MKYGKKESDKTYVLLIIDIVVEYASENFNFSKFYLRQDIIYIIH